MKNTYNPYIFSGYSAMNVSSNHHMEPL
jgi:hypothetical protein